MNNPKIYISCKKAKHLGFWVDCVKTDWTQIGKLAEALVKKSSEEDDEWEISLSENFHLEIANDEDLDDVCNWAKIVLEHEEAGVFFVKKMKEMERGADLVSFNNHYLGWFETLEEFAQEYIAEKENWDALKDKFPFWAEHIDWEAVVETIEASDNYHSLDGVPSGIHVFSFEAQENG